MAGDRQRVLPAEIIPIIDRETERNQARVLAEVAEQLVGRRTGRAALAGEQLDDGARLGTENRRDGRECGRDGGQCPDAATPHADLPCTRPHPNTQLVIGAGKITGHSLRGEVNVAKKKTAGRTGPAVQ